MSDTKIDKAFVDEEAPTPPPSEIGGKGWETDSTKGLSTAEVEKSLEAWGRNEIEVEVTPLYVLFLRQFTGFMPFLIELAAIISLAVQVSWLYLMAIRILCGSSELALFGCDPFILILQTIVSSHLTYAPAS